MILKESNVVVKCLCVNRFLVCQSSDNLERLETERRDTKCVLRIRSMNSQTLGGVRLKLTGTRPNNCSEDSFTALHYSKNTDLAVKAQKQQHDEEENGPQGWQWHHGYSFRVGNEGQAGTWKENREGMGRRERGQN